MTEQGPDAKDQDEQKEPKRSYTPWHYMLAAVFEFLLEPRGYRVESFVKVGTLPLEIDIVVVHQPEARSEGFERLDFIFKRLGPITIIEYKSPDDDLAVRDFDRLLAYALLYRIKEKIGRYADITTITISSKLGETYKKALGAEGIELVAEKDEAGVYRGEGAMFRHFAVAVDELPEVEQSRPLLPLGKQHKGQFTPLIQGSPAERELGDKLWRVATASKELIMQVLTDDDLKTGFRELIMQLFTDEDLRKKSADIRREFAKTLTLEERLEGLKPEERKRLRRLLAEEDEE